MDFGNSQEVTASDIVDLALTETPLYAVRVVPVEEVRLSCKGEDTDVLLLHWRGELHVHILFVQP